MQARQLHLGIGKMGYLAHKKFNTSCLWEAYPGQNHTEMLHQFYSTIPIVQGDGLQLLIVILTSMLFCGLLTMHLLILSDVTVANQLGVVQCTDQSFSSPDVVDLP